ncbi:phage tail protein [uncultured Aquabacterium sp.]|uniref:phage tail protein n=1 Tax=uncultured Aquabacterium sp. TaxID=158753 RepID=UPI0025F9BE23|nr:phage tail protein [uncultured Aquabacterium sp.]
MAARLPDGAIVSLATTYGTAKTVSGISNANPGVATSTAHGLANGALVSVTSGWSNLNNRVVRVAGSATNTFNLDGIDTTSVTQYPAGSGGGSVQEITGFTQIAQIMGFSTSGGEQQFATFSFLEQNFDTQIPTTLSAQSITLDIADDPTLPGYQALKAASDARAVRALRLSMPDGSFILYQGYVSFNETPTVTKGSVMQVRATFSLQGRPVRYAS